MTTHFSGGHHRLRPAAVHARHRFRAWRRERPFWAGLFTSAAGLPILYWPYANLDLGGIPLALSTTSGAGSLVIGVLLVTLGVTLWYRPQLRVFAGIATLLLALISRRELRRPLPRAGLRADRRRAGLRLASTRGRRAVAGIDGPRARRRSGRRRPT
ncbi:DUF6114 domain-containing protein [Streptomyces sp. NPDC054771]